MVIEIPNELLGTQGKSEAEVRLELAIFFYVNFKASSGRCAKFAGIPRVVFLDELGKRGFHVNYDEAAALSFGDDPKWACDSC
ncbi:MAG: UPF0175 family protein [Saprospiraceae bacterium]|nr:UPF0175 family protein [Saprospiraceae bacterium]